MRQILFTAVVILLVLACKADASAQANWAVGGRLGLSIFSGSGGGEVRTFNPQTFQFETTSSSSTSAGLQIGFTGEVILQKVYGIVSEFNLNTQGGTPIEWSNSFRYHFLIPGSRIKAYANGGFDLWFFTGGPYFGIPLGGGAFFPIANKLYIPADIKLGPVFVTGSTVFYIAITSGIRYEI